MNKINKLLLNRFGKLFLLIGIVFAISGIKNANAQVEIKCVEKQAHTHKFIPYKYSWGSIRSSRSQTFIYLDKSFKDGFLTGVSHIDTLDKLPYLDFNTYISIEPIDICVAWGLFINGQQVSNMDQLLQKIPSKDTGTFRTKVIESLNTMELQKIYDPNLLRN